MADGLNTKPSRLLQRLDTEIASASSMFVADCKRAERAGYLARLGRFDEADAELKALRSRYEHAPNVRISAWLNFAEGLMHHAKDLHQNSRDKFLRAYSISAASGFVEVQALSAAWLAHMDYLNSNWRQMGKNAAEAIRLASTHNPAALARASLVVGQAYHFAGRFDLAATWYRDVHRLSLADGDDMTFSALLVNMSGLKSQQLRVRAWRDEGTITDDDFSVLSSESAVNFDRLVQAGSLTSLAPTRLAQAMCVLGRFGEALELFRVNIPIVVSEGLERLRADFLSDVAWCKLNVGDREGAAIDAWAVAKLIERNPCSTTLHLSTGDSLRYFSSAEKKREPLFMQPSLKVGRSICLLSSRRFWKRCCPVMKRSNVKIEMILQTGLANLRSGTRRV